MERRWSAAEVTAVTQQPDADDPMVTVAQAAELLGASPDVVRRLVKRGLSAKRGRPAPGEPWIRLSDLERVEVPAADPAEGWQRGPWVRPVGRVTLQEAARIAGVSITTLRTRYIGTSVMPRQKGARFPVLRTDAEALGRRLRDRLTIREAAQRLGWTLVGVRRLLRAGELDRCRDRDRPVLAVSVQELLDSGWRPPVDPAHEGRVPTLVAARILGLSLPATRERAAQGRVPAARDARGGWWFRPDQLEAIARARRSEDAGDLVDQL
jgi:hypothetical protein